MSIFRSTAATAAAACLSLLFGPVIQLPAAAAAAAAELPEPAAHEVREAPEGSVTDRFIVKFSDASRRSPAERDRAYDRAAGAVGTAAEEKRTTADGAKVIETGRELSAADAGKLAGALEARADVEYAEPDILFRPVMTPNDTHYGLQWDLSGDQAGMRMPAAWDLATGAGTVVAVVDTGITAHSDLDVNVLPGYDMISDAGVSRDGNGRDPSARDEGDWCEAEASSWHGTHVAGTIAAVANNGKGVTGVAYDARILPVRALGACGGYLSDISDSVIWAAGGSVPGAPANPNPADVINLSLGAQAACTTGMQSAIDFATGTGASVVVAAGNENQPAANVAPANCANVITVASSGPDGSRAPYSNYGSSVDVTAPGGDMTDSWKGGIASTMNDGTTTPSGESYAYSEGTSMAAPHVAGLAALMLSAGPGLAPADLEAQLKATARPITSCSAGCGAGLVDAAAAVGAAGPVSEPAPSPAAEPAEPTLSAGSPAITGTAAVGATLTADPGTWTPGTTLAYQWNRNGTAIPGAAAKSYTPVPDDAGATLTVTVTGSQDGYAPASATSAATVPVAAGTLQTSAPTISGTVKVGYTLTAAPGTWTAGTTLAYQWYRSGSAVLGATGPKYALTAADAGKTITVRVTGTKAGYTAASRVSAGTPAVAPGTLQTSAPTISGTVKVGYTLTAAPGTWTSGTSLKYQWYRSGTAITGATAKSYQLTGTDAGKLIKVRVTGSLAGYTTAFRDSANTPAVAPGTLQSSVPTISGTAQVGQTLTASKGTWSWGTSFAYQWLRNGTPVAGATASTYKPSAADVGARLAVRVTGTRTGYTPVARTSAATAAVVKGTLQSTAPTISGTVKVGSTLTALTGTWTWGTSFTYQWYRSGTPVTGATGKTYTVVSADRGHRLKVRVTGTKAGYTTVQRYSPETSRL
ncbi:S8 family serine peptidase [Arthrobacter mobilis]|uniref:S8 family serine peptidase n=1 Tax=Arthrobacter mobilis TaxID=2724944 RepID=A0A7X6H9Q9_9MICC|nr:S8 family serine peptidase [Arthrobacter mobilis]NKX53056.1 S8 family serine peptidase [Arthrobacter mobilis]